jgi:beta-phosphoglucomutase-like phosphatase (HAD superfamily)
MPELSINQFEAVAFDFDGIIADSNGGHTLARVKAAEELAVELGIPGLANIPLAIHEEAHFHAVTTSTIIRWALIEGGVLLEDAELDHPVLLQVIQRKHEVYDREGVGGLVAIPGVLSFVGRLATYRAGHLGIASGARRSEVDTFLTRGDNRNLHRYFGNNLVTADDNLARKPDPETYQRIMAMMKVRDPQACLVVEDHPLGVEAGKAAGATVVALTTTHEAEALQAADHIFPGYPEFAKHLLQ